MLNRTRRHLVFVALAAGAALVGCSADATDGSGGAGDPDTATTSASEEALAAVAQDPDFVQTPAGFYHRSCVHDIGDDATVDENDNVTKADGTRYKLPPCAHPHYPLRGPHAQAAAAPPVEPTVSGWVTDGWRTNAGGYTHYTTDFYVPREPTTNGAVIFFFPGIEPSDGTRILQPVLTHGYSGNNYWQIGSWSCGSSCPHSTLKYAAVGDRIVGTLNGMNCWSGVCYWGINTHDTTNGNSTTLGWQASVKYTYAYATLEAYYLNSCGQYPNQSQLTFYNTYVTRADGSTATGNWNLWTGNGSCGAYSSSPGWSQVTVHF